MASQWHFSDDESDDCSGPCHTCKSGSSHAGPALRAVQASVGDPLPPLPLVADKSSVWV